MDYCHYLLISLINYSLTNFGEHSEKFSHDAINRYLAGEKVTPHLVWENVKGQMVQLAEGTLCSTIRSWTRISRSRWNWYGANGVRMHMGYQRGGGL
jgi:hypothetical protein